MRANGKNGDILKAPFPAFGGKSAVAGEAWKRFGDVLNYVEPFCFSAAVLLGRPAPFAGTETINDLNGYVANFWRGVQSDPEAVARAADSPVNECDLTAWHLWLVEKREWLVERLMSDPQFYDPLVAGKWCWGQCCWIGSGWCSGEGPWHRVQGEDGTWQLVHLGDAGQGVNRKLVHLGDAGRGVNRQRVHLGDAGRGVKRKRPNIGGQPGSPGKGVNSAGAMDAGVYAWIQALAERLRRVRVCCGDWSRVCGPTPTVKQGLTAMFLDPPYSVADRADVYGHTEDRTLRDAVQAWCRQWQDDPLMRIALCGYEGEYDLPGWECFAWKAKGGYGSQSKNGNDNCRRERIWFSPRCLRPRREVQRELLGAP